MSEKFIKRVCQLCGKDFLGRAANINYNPKSHKFCSRECANTSRRKREIRTCKKCKNEFEFQLCYKKRSWKAGTFCSEKCRNTSQFGENNPTAGELSIYGTKVVSNARHLRLLQKYKKLAMEKVASLWGTGISCFNCGCDDYKSLQINHLKIKHSRETGGVLWRKVIRMADIEVKEHFDIRCALCNWSLFIEEKYKTKYQITYLGKND